MADKASEKPEVAAPVAGADAAPAAEATNGGEQELGGKDEAKPVGAGAGADGGEGAKASADAANPSSAGKAAETAAEQPAGEQAQDKPAADADTEMKDVADKDADKDVAADKDTEDAAPEAATVETPAAKGKGSRRKSAAGEPKGKTLSKKGSKARVAHIDAKPGDHFLIKLKGFPAWPAIVCDDSMLPAALANSRPVSAAKEDGSYAEAYADGGKRVYDRTFPVMYLYTNEFGWVQNTALSELTAEKAKESITDKMRKDLKAAFELAAEHNPVDHYKEILKKFQEEQIAQGAKSEQVAATPKRPKKAKTKAAEADDDVDIDDADAAPKSSKSKKRKAEEDTSTPQRADSVKKPKIKLNTSSTPKTANGVATPKSAGGDSAAKSAKSKLKKGKEGGDKKPEPPKEPKMTPEERHARKEKEVLYLRHKLQRGLLTREQQPREDEMKSMSDYITVLENFADLEVSIIRATKINKVLKAILKLESVPREEEFQFKKRSQSLLDKWNKLLAGDASGLLSASTNGVNGASEKKSAEHNGVKDEAGEPNKAEPEKAAGAAEEETGAKDKSADAAEAKGDRAAAEAATSSEPVAAEN